ncbi:hypothetical protein B0H14DRAFT_2558277 [Mycena olivaceomarginata]|nr:hypothetical protein B0H14DRAFT_2558277 [Mycena olivaceomarginata]
MSHHCSPTHHGPSHSQPETPDPSHDYSTHLKNLILLCTPSKSGQELTDVHLFLKLTTQLAACIDDQGRTVQHLKHRLVDTENENNNPSKRSCCSRNHQTEGVGEESWDFTPKELEGWARHTGHKFVILCGLWFCLDDDDYAPFF